MATPAYIAIFHKNEPLPGTVSLHDHEGEEGKKSCTPVLELDHRVRTVKDCWDCGIRFYSRSHDDFSVTIPLNSLAPRLHHFLRCQTFLTKVELYLYKFNKKQRKEMEYFRVTMEHVLVSRLKLISYNIKTPGFERYDPMLKVCFRFQRITWLYTKGYIIATDEWDQAFDPQEMRDFSKTDESLYEPPIPLPPLKINPRILKIVEPEDGLEPGKPFETKLDCLLSRAPSDHKERLVWISLWSRYKGKVREMCLAEDARIDDKGNTVVRSPSLPENPDWKNDPDKSPSEPVEYWWKAESKCMDGFFEGEKVRFPKKKKVPKIPVFVDCHMHYFSPKAAPLPTIWAQQAGAKLLIPDWDKAEKEPNNTVLKWFTHDYPAYAKMTTEELGKKSIDESKKVLKDGSLYEQMGDTGERGRILIALGIDMELAHYRGYEAITVYEKDEKNQPGYWKYEGDGKREWVPLSEKDALNLVQLDMQMYESKNVFNSHHGGVLNFFPFDPRRWQGKKINTWGGKPNKPFEYIIQSSLNPEKLKSLAACIGFKLYTALGIRPDDYKPRMVTGKGKIPQRKILDEKLPDLKEFYSTCDTKNIPIICHCSRGGIFAHDYHLYYDYLFGADDASQKEKKEYFFDVYVSPFAWEPVLNDFPNLKLCLAHFGGEDEWEKEEESSMPWAEKCAQLASDPKRPNFYVDLSYFTFKSIEFIDCYKANCPDKDCPFRGKHVQKTYRCKVNGTFEIPAKDKIKKMIAKYPKLKEKILFGTDWYLIGGEKEEYGRYEKYFKRSIEVLYDIDPELPAYAMAINPKRFLDLENVAKKICDVWGPEYAKLLHLVQDKIHDSIGKYYV